MKRFLLISLLIAVLSCKKESKQECPVRTYNVQCSERSPDFEFPGYLESTNRYLINSTCLEEAIKAAQEMSFDFGNSYKHCQIVQ